MPRGMQDKVAAAAQRPVVAPCIFVEMLFDAGPVRLWSGLGNLIWDGKEWLGGGELLSVSDVPETSAVQADGVSVTLSGIPEENISLALNEHYQGRACNLWFGLLGVDQGGELETEAGGLLEGPVGVWRDDTGTRGQLVGDPVMIFRGRMDLMPIEDDGADTVSITITAENRLLDLERANERRYTDADQQIDFPGDKGLSEVNDAAEKEILWGRA